VEGHLNSNSKGVNPVAECTVVLYALVAKGTHSFHWSDPRYIIS